MTAGPIGGAGAARPDFEVEDDDAAGGPAQAPAAQIPGGGAVISRQPTSARPVPGAAPTAQVGPGGGARPPEETVRAFYEAFTNHRWDEVDALYAKDVRYEDPLFKHGNSGDVIHMWRTLFQADELEMSYEITGVEGDVVKGRWTADYKFHGRPVHEVSESTFKVQDGKIVSHRDDFSVVAWAKQALPLGPLEIFADTVIGRAVITRLMRWGIRLAEEKLPRLPDDG